MSFTLCRIFEGDDNIGKKQKASSYDHFRNRMSNIMANKSNIMPHAVSTAMDARLETGVQLAAELRLKVRLRLQRLCLSDSLKSKFSCTTGAISVPDVFLPGLVGKKDSGKTKDGKNNFR